MPVMDEQDLADMVAISRVRESIPLSKTNEIAQGRWKRFRSLSRKVWVRTDSPDWLVDLVLTARLRHAAEKGRNWAAEVQKLAGPRLDAIWLHHHAARRTEELRQRDCAELRASDPRFARFHLALMIEDEGRPPRRVPTAEAA